MYLVKRPQRDAPTADGVLSTTYCQTKVRNISQKFNVIWQCFADIVILQSIFIKFWINN